ncbi:MAG: hypothetical protein PHT58_07810 [Eubacteriales bacterium]|nr:hypothetical protein [Eubacteriales bacterium]
MTKIIAFEGIDGTGKSVQMDLLKARLERAGKTVATLSFPMYDTFFGDYVGRYLTAKDGIPADAVDGKSMALWFALDRFEAFRTIDYSGSDYLLINRYVLSNAVYQSIRDCDLDRPDILDFVLELEHDHFHIPRPDLHLILDMDTFDASHNVEKKGFRDYVGDAKDIYEAHESIQTRARNKYLSFASRMDNVKVIACMENGKLRSIDTIASLINDSIGI